MIYKSAKDIVAPSNLNKKKYPDVGVLTCSYSSKVKLYGLSKGIIDDVVNYSNWLSEKGIPNSVQFGIDDSKFFYLESIIIRIPCKSNILVNIDLKESYNYSVLIAELNKNGMEISNVVVGMYRKYWLNALYAVFEKSNTVYTDMMYKKRKRRA